MKFLISFCIGLQVYFASVNLTVSEDHPSSSVLISISATNPASFEYSVVVTPIADTALGTYVTCEESNTCYTPTL